MKRKLLLSAVLIQCIGCIYAQKGTDNKDKTFKEKVEQFGQDLIAQPEKTDTNANKLINDNMSLEVPPLWREKGTYTIVQFNLPKTDFSPLKETLPNPDKKVVQSIVVNMTGTKKSAADKKAELTSTIKKHLATYFKDGAITKTAQEISDIANTMFVGSEEFTTQQGKSGELVYYQDVDSKQSAFIVLMLLPDAAKGVTYSVQFNYIRYNYETNYPEDPLEWRTFLYQDEQQSYVDFTKNILKTFKVK